VTVLFVGLEGSRFRRECYFNQQRETYLGGSGSVLRVAQLPVFLNVCVPLFATIPKGTLVILSVHLVT
jgi:hypothetical protein